MVEQAIRDVEAIQRDASKCRIKLTIAKAYASFWKATLNHPDLDKKKKLAYLINFERRITEDVKESWGPESELTIDRKEGTIFVRHQDGRRMKL